jgi:hypothetical protein
MHGLVLAALLALGASAKAPRKVPNMPLGWTWPPSVAMKAAGTSCLAKLDAADVTYVRGKPTPKIATPIVLPDMTLAGIVLVPLKGKGIYPMDCHLAAAIVEVAPTLRALGVASLRFRSLHSYRTVRKKNKKTRILSRHAIGLAMDLFEVSFADGATLVVEEHWSAPDLRLAQVAAAFDGSDFFRTPLTPANDPHDHADHVHIEAHMRL